MGELLLEPICVGRSSPGVWWRQIFSVSPSSSYTPLLSFGSSVPLGKYVSMCLGSCFGSSVKVTGYSFFFTTVVYLSFLMTSVVPASAMPTRRVKPRGT